MENNSFYSPIGKWLGTAFASVFQFNYKQRNHLSRCSAPWAPNDLRESVATAAGLKITVSRPGYPRPVYSVERILELTKMEPNAGTTGEERELVYLYFLLYLSLPQPPSSWFLFFCC